MMYREGLNMELVGKVKSGYGNASFWVKKINEIFKEKYGMKLFPGTLNIEIDSPYILETDNKILPDEYNGQYTVLIKEGTIFGHKIFILRPEINNKEGGDHALNIIEIVSDVNLRESNNLKDGDIVIIKI